MGAECQTAKKTENCCGYGKETRTRLQTHILNTDYPEPATLQKNRRWNDKAKPPQSIDSMSSLSDKTKIVFDDEKVNQPQMIQIDVIDEQLFDRFDAMSKDIIFGYIHDVESMLNERDISLSYDSKSEDSESSEDDILETTPMRIPNNIHYLILLYYYLMENEFENEALKLWNERAELSEFMCTTIQSTRARMWDKFDKHSKGMLSTEKYLPKFVYTISVLRLKSKQRKSNPPKYSKVKNCAKYMALLMIQSLPIDQKKYIDKQHFVDNIHIYLSSIC